MKEKLKEYVDKEFHLSFFFFDEKVKLSIKQTLTVTTKFELEILLAMQQGSLNLMQLWLESEQ